ncbi:hypothetical protein ABPG75_011668 [Micractinium tetrahymenae]
MEAAPPAQRRKSKNKFKPAPAEPPKPAQPAQQLHRTHAADGKLQKKRRKAKKQQRAVQDVDDTVGVQADAPQQRQQQAAAAPPGGSGGGSSPFAPASWQALVSSKKGKGGGSLLAQMRARLQGGRFRWLNEALYTSDGATALAMVRKEPELMDQYHEGFREQTKGWPVQPVDQAIAWLRRRPPGITVADLGCGDAKIAATLAPCGYTVHSFDLAETAPGVVACNMAALPLGDAAVDAAVFCLSLMGTDYGLFLEEAARVLRPAGWLWIAEVQSRFVDDGGRSVLPAFEAALGALGFAVRRKDTSNSHFFVLEAQRQARSGGGKPKQRVAWPELRACQYKKR